MRRWMGPVAQATEPILLELEHCHAVATDPLAVVGPIQATGMNET